MVYAVQIYELSIIIIFLFGRFPLPFYVLLSMQSGMTIHQNSLILLWMKEYKQNVKRRHRNGVIIQLQQWMEKNTC